jgi:hypothetical protein
VQTQLQFVEGKCAANRESHFSNVTFDHLAKMDVPDLGDMVRAKWIVDWDTRPRTRRHC